MKYIFGKKHDQPSPEKSAAVRTVSLIGPDGELVAITSLPYDLVVRPGDELELNLVIHDLFPADVEIPR